MGALIALAPLLPTLIKGVETLFRGKDKSGADKMDAVMQMARAVVTKMLASGVPGSDGKTLVQPSDEQLLAAAETAFQNMKSTGELMNDVYLVRGTVTQIR